MDHRRNSWPQTHWPLWSHHLHCWLRTLHFRWSAQRHLFWWSHLLRPHYITIPSSRWNFIKPTSPTPPGEPITQSSPTTISSIYLVVPTVRTGTTIPGAMTPRLTPRRSCNCTGFIPEACEGHAATIVGDIMYVFGGRSRESKDLGLLSALIIPSQKSYNFSKHGALGLTPDQATPWRHLMLIKLSLWVASRQLCQSMIRLIRYSSWTRIRLIILRMQLTSMRRLRVCQG